MKEIITPVGLKGNEINERMKQLMGIASINENRKISTIELTKMGPDGKVYGIVRENHEYYIKVTNKQANLVAEDFSYIGGLQNKKQEAYPNYANALKHLNLKFNSLNEAYGKSGQINVFKNDNLKENMGYGFSNEGNLEGNKMSECCGAQTMEGMCMECGGSAYGMNEFDKPAMDSFKDQYGDKGKNIYYATANKQNRDPETFEKNEELEMTDDNFQRTHLDGPSDWPDYDYNHNDYSDDSIRDFDSEHSGANLPDELQAVDDMYENEMTDKEKRFAALAEPYDKVTYADKIAGATKGKNESKLSIEKSINEMDYIIESITNVKKKVYTLK